MFKRIINILFRVDDKASAPIQKIEKNVTKLNFSLKWLGKTVLSFGKKIAGLGYKMTGLRFIVKNLASGFRRWAMALPFKAIKLLTVAVAGLTVASIHMSGKMEKWKITMESFTGSTEKAKKTLSELIHHYVDRSLLKRRFYGNYLKHLL